jgi:serine/threonine protein phosphatase 1
MLGRLFASLRSKQTSQTRFAPLAPNEPFYAVGDVHGCSALLAGLLAKFDPALPVVMVGDYVDRGDDSRGVLAMLMDRPGTTCLRGNHEQMLIDYLARPEEAGARFLRNGGLQTLASFGIGGVQPTSEPALLADKAEALRAAMGQPMIDWLDRLPCQFVVGQCGGRPCRGRPRRADGSAGPAQPDVGAPRFPVQGPQRRVVDHSRSHHRAFR